MKNENQKYCQDCGNLILIKAEICPHCGVRQQPVTASSDKSRLTAAILALFLGWIGIHKFYLNKNMQGLIYLAFFWTAIPAIISLFEGLNYLFMSDATFFNRYITPK